MELLSSRKYWGWTEPGNGKKNPRNLNVSIRFTHSLLMRSPSEILGVLNMWPPLWKRDLIHIQAMLYALMREWYCYVTSPFSCCQYFNSFKSLRLAWSRFANCGSLTDCLTSGKAAGFVRHSRAFTIICWNENADIIIFATTLKSIYRLMTKTDPKQRPRTS